MQLFNELDNDNFVMFAVRNYNNPQCTDIDEFNEDLNRFKYLKRLFGRYKQGDLQERLILNHLVIIFNVFGISAAKKMIFYKIEKDHWPALKTFLIFLNYLKEDDYIDVPLDNKVINVLRKL